MGRHGVEFWELASPFVGPAGSSCRSFKTLRDRRRISLVQRPSNWPDRILSCVKRPAGQQPVTTQNEWEPRASFRPGGPKLAEARQEKECWAIDPWVECLPSICEALGWTPSLKSQNLEDKGRRVRSSRASLAMSDYDLKKERES